jgi:hypothetical protein
MLMRFLASFLLLLVSTLSFGQMLNDSPFDASISNPKYKKQKGPTILIDAGHHNFIVEMGLIKPFVDLSTNDGYQPIIDSGVFTPAYLSNYQMALITPAMPFKFGSKKEVTNEITYTADELTALKDWVNKGGALIMLSEHAPIDKSMTPLFNTFGIQLSIGAVFDSLNYDTSIKLASAETMLIFNNSNGLLNSDHPVITGNNRKELVQNIETYTGSALTGAGYTNIFKLSTNAKIKKWNGSQPSGGGDSQCLVGRFGKGKVVALGDCNGFTAMYINTGGKKFSAGMQVETYDWRQFVLNTLHWLSN